MKKLVLFLLSNLALLSSYAALTPLVDSIPMSDGRKLAADIYIPSGMSSGPVILIQTPYNRQVARFTGLPLGIGMNLNASQYIFVIVDWRGFYGSAQAAYMGSPDNGSDGYNNVEWIAGQTWSNGKIGTWGPSALGKVQFQTAKKNPPHLVCICPSVAAPQFLYNEYYPNGALRTEYVEQLDGLGFGLTPLLMAHPYKDNTWNFVENANDYPDSIRVPCFMVGGWYDHNTQLMMDYFMDIRAFSFFSVRNKHKILMGPWVHGGSGIARVGTSIQGELSYPNAANKNDSMSLQFFDFYLRGINNNWESNALYTYYQMGSNRWETSTNWPPNGLQPVRFYLHSDNGLYNDLPNGAKDSFNLSYNPADPSPTIGGSVLRADLNQGPYDQRKGVENRNDVLVFSTDILNQDLVLKGQIKVHLQVGSDRLDTDFDVRITDVYPDSSSMLVGDAVMRMRFRNGFTQAQTAMMQPGKIYDCVILLPTTSITFLKGHRLRLVISSSNYPRFNRNMNTGGNMYPGNSTDSLDNPLIATNTVYTNSANSSYMELPLLNYSYSVQEQIKQKHFAVYPNPVVDILNIQTTEMALLKGIQVYTSDGRLLIHRELPTHALDVSTLKPGLYLLTLITEKGTYSIPFYKE